MNIKMIVLAALAYTLWKKHQTPAPAPSAPVVTPPTQAEIQAKLMQSAQQVVQQAQDVISTL